MKINSLSDFNMEEDFEIDSDDEEKTIKKPTLRELDRISDEDTDSETEVNF